MTYLKKVNRKTGIVTIHNTTSSMEAIAYHEKARRTLINSGSNAPMFYIKEICDATGKKIVAETDKLDALAKPSEGLDF